MRRVTFAAVILLAFALPVAGAPQFECARLTGFGSFTVQAVQPVWVTSGIHWHVHATGLTIQVTDDSFTPLVAHPMRPNNYLVVLHNETTTQITAAEADLEFTPHGESDSVLLLRASQDQTETGDGAIGIEPTPAKPLEKTHFGSDNAVPAPRLQPPANIEASLHIALDDQHYALKGAQRGHSWGWTIAITSPNTHQVLETGHYQTSPLASGLAPTDHYVVADLEFTSNSTLVGPADLYAPSIQVAVDGALRMENTTGTIQAKNGLAAPQHLDIGTKAGTFALAQAGNHIVGGINVEPLSVTAAELPRYSVWPYIAVPILGLIYCWPALRGKRLGRFQFPPQAYGWRLARAEAFALWASMADARGFRRTAAALAGRAVANSPHVSERRTEHGILLRQAGKPRAALLEHERAEDLAREQDTTASGWNAFQASLACAEQGDDQEALRWLQTALERDPGLVAETKGQSRFRRLWGHPDYEGMVKAPA